MVCKMSHVPLNAKHCMQNLKKKSSLWWRFSVIKMKTDAYISLTLKYCSAKVLFLFKRDCVCTIYALNDPNTG